MTVGEYGVRNLRCQRRRVVEAGAGPRSVTYGSGEYPVLATAHPVFLAVEQAGTRWRIPGPANPTPQEARDELAHQFPMCAARASAGSSAAIDYREAADVFDRERHDEIHVAGGYFRVPCAAGRWSGWDRMAPSLPARPKLTARCPDAPPMKEQFLDDVPADYGPEVAALKAEAATAVTKVGGLPPENIADERRALEAYWTWSSSAPGSRSAPTQAGSGEPAW